MSGSWVVTGAGLVSAAGDSPEKLFAALERATPLMEAEGALEERAVPNDNRSDVARDGVALPVFTVPIRGFDPKTYLKRKGLKDLSRTSQLACSAASLVAPSLSGIAGENVGVAFGSAWGSLKTVVDFERAAHVDGPRFVDPLLFTETVANVPAGQVSIFFGWSAFNGTLSAGTSSGLEAIRWALDQLEEGRAVAAVAGGGDEINLPLLGALSLEGLTARSLPSLPFTAERTGLIGGEGACFLAIEEESRARARESMPLARILACGSRFEAPQPSGLDRLTSLIRGLLTSAGLEAGQIDLLVVSANGGLSRDASEALAILSVFGAGSGAPPVLAPKGVLGETWGASGPFGVVSALEAMGSDLVPGRAGEGSVDPAFKGLNLSAESLSRPVERTLVIDCAESGHVSGLILEAL